MSKRVTAKRATMPVARRSPAAVASLPIAIGQPAVEALPPVIDDQPKAKRTPVAGGQPKAKAKPRLRKPYQQGDLDGLCGVYSVVNAARALCPEVNHDAAEWLFDELMRSLPKVEADASVAVSSGLGRRHLVRLLKRAIGYLGGEHDIRLRLTRPPDRLLSKPMNLDALWRGSPVACLPDASPCSGSKGGIITGRSPCR